MALISLPYGFQQALLNSESYPRNTIVKTINTYPKSLRQAENRLSERECDLFEDNRTKWEIPIRDLDTASGKVLEKYNIHSHDKLLEWLGIDTQASTHDSTAKTISGTKRDPKCRFICICASNSRSKLKLTKAMLTDILTFHQVMPAFLDFLYVFGEQIDATDLQFSSFHEQVVLAEPLDGMPLAGLGRSGKHYQICYNLKSVALTSVNKEDFTLNVWSIRQAVFHHQFDVVNGNTLWIVVKGNLEIQQRFKALTDKDARAQDKSFSTPEECFRSSLSAQLTYCYWASEDWRWHIKWLEEAMDKEHIMALLGPSTLEYAHKIYTPEDIQNLQIWEERTRQAIVALEGNVDVMLALVEFYRRLAQDRNFPLRKTCSSDISILATQVSSITTRLKMQIKRAEFLVRTISDRRQLVIQHLQSQSASRAERLSRNMEQEQVFMLIITVMTLIYLPATFVSTFFSTDVVKYQGSDSPGGTFSEAAMVRWLQVTIPLTVLTCGVAWWARRWMLAKRRDNGFRRRWIPWRLKIVSFDSPATVLPLHKKSFIEEN
ncbi:hypothetical protein F4677DRAFT_438915 [Hypoxylon crocopeplum]|nr:hypothetical protein F4677DRAFT_438915 [Hypoxylon crocopeplum]